MKVKDWSKFQHYNTRKPPWIKLYKDLLNDMEWHNLKPENAKLLVNLWLLASEDWDMEGKLPEIPKLAWRLRLTEKQLIKQLQDLTHWLEHDASDALEEDYSDASDMHAQALAQKRREEKRRGEEREKIPPDLTDVKNYFKEKGIGNGEANRFMDHHQARGWILTNGKQMRDWKASVRTWISNIDKFSKKDFKKPGEKEITYV